MPINAAVYACVTTRPNEACEMIEKKNERKYRPITVTSSIYETCVIIDCLQPFQRYDWSHKIYNDHVTVNNRTFWTHVFKITLLLDPTSYTPK